MNLRKIGYESEKLVKNYFEKKGFSIIDQNFTIRGGELDIIAEDQQTRVFVEVKNTTHTEDLHNYISPKKISTLLKTANFYNYKNPTDKELRVDLVFVKQNNIIQHCENISNS